jgi:uncharacterized protein YqeY
LRRASTSCWRTLPRQLDDDAVRAVLREVIATTGRHAVRDIGKVMGPTMARLKGQVDGTRVQQSGARAV